MANRRSPSLLKMKNESAGADGPYVSPSTYSTSVCRWPTYLVIYCIVGTVLYSVPPRYYLRVSTRAYAVYVLTGIPSYLPYTY
jgi:hypothetical protein